MYHRLFLVAALLNTCAEGSSVHGPSETVLALAGGDVILPCSFNITADDEFPAVEWSKEGLQPNVVFLYRDDHEIHEMKNPAFIYRTSLIMKELRNRNISLRISNVQLSDAGKYSCMRLFKDPPRIITTVELVVGAASEPRLLVVAAERAGVTLQCEANCWLPEPEIKFLDDRGNNIPADEPRRHQDAHGCYTMTQRVTLQDAITWVTCRVHQPEINQTRDKEILIPVDKRSCFLTTSITVGGIGLLLLASGFVFILLKRRGKSVKGPKLPVSRQPSDESTVSAASESQPFILSVRADRTDNVRNETMEDLKGEVDDLKSKLREKEEIIHKLQNDKSQPCCCHLGQPVTVSSTAGSSSPMKSVAPIPRMHRIHSSPAVLGSDVAELPRSSSVCTSKKMLGDIRRSMSESSAQPEPRLHKLKRRYSLVLTSSALSNNRFSVLAGVTEESENLVS